MLTVDIASLESGLHTLEIRPTAEDLELDPNKFKEIRIEVRLDIQERRILAMIDARARATLICDRTLRPFEQEIGGSFTLLFEAAANVVERGDGYNEVRVFDPDEHEIDLTDVARDTILLSVPQRCVAPGAEEEEIPTEFGAPENEVDPRWETLRKLRSADD